MKKLSTGTLSTLAGHRREAVDCFGEDSAAVKYLDEQIAKYGEHAEVLIDERVMVQALVAMHMAGVVSGDFNWKLGDEDAK